MADSPEGNKVALLAARVTLLGILVSAAFNLYDRWSFGRTAPIAPIASAVAGSAVQTSSLAAPAETVTRRFADGATASLGAVERPMTQPDRDGLAAADMSLAPRASEVTTPRMRPSFSCDLAGHAYQSFEIAICNSAELVQADLALSAAYDHARSRANARQRALLKLEQRAWMASRSQCSTDACLLDTYRQRSVALMDPDR